MKITTFFVFLLAVWILGQSATAGENQPPTRVAPYPASPVIKSLMIQPDRLTVGNGDNWPITWADDGNQYTFYCDGDGFGGGSGNGSMCPAMILGSPPNFTGQNIATTSGRKTGGGPEGRKASGLLMVEGVLYVWARNLNKDGTGSSLAWSADRAKTWTWAAWSFPEIGYPVWLNAGQNNDAAQDEYITDRNSYRFFSGLDVQGAPQWTTEGDRRKPVFTDPGHCYRPEVVYNPGIKRYLLCTATSGSPRWCGTDEKYLGIFDAPTPWGPWTTVKRIHGWGEEENPFQPRIPSKWISDDGMSFYLLYSCFPKGPYKFNVQKCSLEISQ